MRSDSVLAGRYRLIEPLGAGGMSVVWRAHDEVLDRPVAIKLLNDPVEPRLRVLLQAEARAAAAVNHPVIAQVFDYGQAASEHGATTPYLVMELVNGMPLDRWLASRATISAEKSMAICADIADALSAVHQHGLVHRDVKPANVIITERGPKLVDFGICAPVGEVDGSDDGRLVGTPGYVAPERIAAVPVGPAADVYALGLLFYRMVAGRPPWHVDSTAGLLQAHMFAEPTPLPAQSCLPPGVATLVMKCLDKEPARRPSARDLANVLQRKARADSIPAGTAGTEDPCDGEAEATAAIYEPVVALSTDSLSTGSLSTGSLSTDSAGTSRQRAGARTRALAALAGLVMVIGLLGIAWSARGGRRGAGASTAPSAATSACDAVFAVDRDWGSGFDATVTVHNRALALQNWTVSFDFPGDQTIIERFTDTAMTLQSSDVHSAPATVTQSGSRVVATAEGALSPGATVKLAFSGAYHEANPLPTTVWLSDHRCATQVSGASGTPSPAATPKRTKAGDAGGGGADTGSPGGDAFNSGEIADSATAHGAKAHGSKASKAHGGKTSASRSPEAADNTSGLAPEHAGVASNGGAEPSVGAGSERGGPAWKRSHVQRHGHRPGNRPGNWAGNGSDSGSDSGKAEEGTRGKGRHEG